MTESTGRPHDEQREAQYSQEADRDDAAPEPPFSGKYHCHICPICGDKIQGCAGSDCTTFIVQTERDCRQLDHLLRAFGD